MDTKKKTNRSCLSINPETNTAQVFSLSPPQVGLGHYGENDNALAQKESEWKGTR